MTVYPCAKLPLQRPLLLYRTVPLRQPVLRLAKKTPAFRRCGLREARQIRGSGRSAI